MIFQRLYLTNAADDKCTLFADRNLINRRNVSKDTKHAYSQNKQMFVLALKARIIAAGMKVLGMEELSGNPTKLRYPAKSSKQDHDAKLKYLRKIASAIVDEYVVDSNTIDKIISPVLLQEEQELAVANQRMTPDGRFRCRFNGCEKTYK